MTHHIVAEQSAPLDTPIVNLASALADHYNHHGPDGVHAASVLVAAVITALAPNRAGVITDTIDSLELDGAT